MNNNVAEMMIKLHEFNKKGLLSDYDFANISKALTNENLAEDEIKQKEWEFNREQQILKNREHSAELRKTVEDRKAFAAYEKRMKREMLYLSILLDRYGNRAFSIKTLASLPYFEIDFLASEIRRMNHKPEFKLLNDEEKRQYIDLVLNEDERKDFKFDYTFPAPTWMQEDAKNKKDVKTNKSNPEDIEAKKKEIADRLFKESVEKDKARQNAAKSNKNKNRINDISNLANYTNNSVQVKKDRSEDIDNIANFDTKQAKNDRSKDINSIANFDTKQAKKDRSEDIKNMADMDNNKVSKDAEKTDKANTAGVELTPKQRFVKSVKNVGEKFKAHPYMIAAGAFVIASLTILISPAAFVTTLTAATAGAYVGNKISGARVRN